MGIFLNIEKATLGEIGFCMRHLASTTNGNIIPIDKSLWNRIGQRLMDVQEELNKANEVE